MQAQPTRNHLQLQPPKSEAPGSIVSLASTLPSNNPNPLHDYYHHLLSDCDYPSLKRILFLQLVTKQNVLIYSKRRAEIKEAWLGLQKKIEKANRTNKKQEGKTEQTSSKGGLYIVDSQTKLEDILRQNEEENTTKPSKPHQKTERLPTNASSPPQKRFLLFDLGTVSTSSLNFLLNANLSNYTILAVQPQSRPIRAQLSDIFPLVFLDEAGEDSAQQQQIEYAKSMGSVSFENDKFQYARELNFSLSLQASKNQECFFKAYTSLLKDRATKEGIILPHSRWRKMPKILHLLGITRIESVFKTLSPVDCLYAPACLGRTPEELQCLSKLNQQILMDLVPMYGLQKWMKQLRHHFWIWKQKKDYFLSLFDKIKGKVSFYYPCVKYAEIVELRHDSADNSLHYKIKGQEKKLLSDKYYKIENESSNSQNAKQYKLSLQYRTKDNVVTHIGIACYDQHRHFISPVQVKQGQAQVCRREESAALVQHVQGDKIIVKGGQQGKSSLSSWSGDNSYGFQRCIGFYLDGDVERFINSDHVLSQGKDPYSKEPNAGAYRSIDNNTINLNPSSLPFLNKLSQKITPGKTKVMNHFQGGTYAIGPTLKGKQENWTNVEVAYKGEGRTNNGSEFLLGTKEVRIVLLVNYNSGFPDFKVEKKEAEVEIKNVSWIEA